MSCDIVWLFGQLVTLWCKKTCLTSRLRALASLFALLFPPYEKQLLYNFLLPFYGQINLHRHLLMEIPLKSYHNFFALP